jgi:hypothetical protein
MPKGDVVKCDAQEVWRIGDVVKATTVLDFKERGKVAANDIGRIKKLMSADKENFMTWSWPLSLILSLSLSPTSFSLSLYRCLFVGLVPGDRWCQCVSRDRVKENESKR